jgi:hypothetical protein
MNLHHRPDRGASSRKARFKTDRAPVKGRERLHNLLKNLVGAGRFELPTPCSRSKCATRLRYAPPDRFVARDMGDMPV